MMRDAKVNDKFLRMIQARAKASIATMTAKRPPTVTNPYAAIATERFRRGPPSDAGVGTRWLVAGNRKWLDPPVQEVLEEPRGGEGVELLLLALPRQLFAGAL